MHHAITLNFGRNTTSIVLNSNRYNLASMLQCDNVTSSGNPSIHDTRF